MNTRPRRPGEQKQPRRQQDDRKQRGHEPVLLRAEAVLFDIWLEIEPDVGAVDHNANHGADDDAYEDDSLLAEVEAVVANVDKWEGLEVGIVDSVDERGVQIREEDCGILHADLHRDQKGVIDDFANGFLALVDFGLRFKHWVASQLA
jgi:hypothetical protein